MGPTRESGGDKQKCPPSAFAHGLGGGPILALALRFEFDGGAPASRSKPSSFFVVRAHAPGRQDQAPFPTHIATRGRGARANARPSLASWTKAN